jgi:hypothetical protein
VFVMNSAPILTLLSVAASAAVLFAVNATPPAPAPRTAAAPMSVRENATTATATAKAALDPPPPIVVRQAVFAGRTAAKEATVAIAVKDGTAIAYVCDGRKVEAWLSGILNDDRLALAGPGGAAPHLPRRGRIRRRAR